MWAQTECSIALEVTSLLHAQFKCTFSSPGVSARGGGGGNLLCRFFFSSQSDSFEWEEVSCTPPDWPVPALSPPQLCNLCLIRYYLNSESIRSIIAISVHPSVAVCKGRRTDRGANSDSLKPHDWPTLSVSICLCPGTCSPTTWPATPSSCPQPPLLAPCLLLP